MSAAPPPHLPAWASRLPKVFRHYNYRLFFVGQVVTLLGTWIQSVALAWLVYHETQSAFLLGLVSFCSQAPIFFIAPLAGAIADRNDRRTVFAWTRAAYLVQSLAMTVLTFGGQIEIATIIILALVLGIVTAIEVPVRQSFTVEMVGREDLRQAIAFNAMMFNFARTIGPAIGGLIVAALGEGLCFLLNTVFSAAVLSSLLMMRLERRDVRPESRPWDDLKQGFHYVTRHPHIRMVLFLSAVTACFGTSYLALLPAFSEGTLRAGPEGLGYLMGAFGVGAVTGAGLVSRLPERRLALLPTMMAVLLGVSLIALANAPSLYAAMFFGVATGLGYIGIAVSSNTQVQLLSDEKMLGRALSFYAMGALGSPPIGALLLGFIADRIGVPNAFMLGGAMCLIAAGISLGSLRRRGLADFSGKTLE
jgi:predicted MFS family arabinose efflux permease